MEKISSSYTPKDELLQRISRHEIPLADLNERLREAGFIQGDATTVIRIMNENQGLCRSESLSKVLDLLAGTPITVTNPDEHANMCTMAGGSGYRTAMQEGFSGKDVAGAVKVVITFADTHLLKRQPIPRDNDLWRTKTATAQVSLIGQGTITPEDVDMISFRFPVALFDENKFTSEERELFENDELRFIVRHYVREINTTTH